MTTDADRIAELEAKLAECKSIADWWLSDTTDYADEGNRIMRHVKHGCAKEILAAIDAALSARES